MPLAPFGKRPLHLTLYGVTNDELDQSVDGFRNVSVRLLKHFGLEEGLDLKVVKRGAPPRGGGEVVFRCPCIRELKPIDLTEEGFVKRIRGVACEFSQKIGFAAWLTARVRLRRCDACIATNVQSNCRQCTRPPEQVYPCECVSVEGGGTVHELIVCLCVH